MTKKSSFRFLPVFAVILLTLLIFSIGCEKDNDTKVSEITLAPGETGTLITERPTPREEELSPTQSVYITEPPTHNVTFAPSSDIQMFITEDLYGKAFTEEIFARTKYTMLNIWATWCTPCIEELPVLQQLSEGYAPLGLQVVGILYDSDTPNAIVAARKLTTNAKVTYTTLCTSPSLNEGLLSTYDIAALPTTLFYDSSGNLLKIEVGAHDYTEWIGIINGVIGAK